MAFITMIASLVSVPVLVLAAYLAVDFYRTPRSRFFRTRQLIPLYLRQKLADILLWFEWRRLQSDVRDFSAAQERYVLRQIRDNENTAYGRDHQFGKIHSLEDFRRLHPLTDYSHCSEYIARVEKGETKAMFGKDTIEMIALTSGTTGKQKHFPLAKRFRQVVLSYVAAERGFNPLKVKPRMSLCARLQRVMCAPSWKKTECGTPLGPISGFHMLDRRRMALNSTPFDAMVDKDQEALYVSLLFALRDRNLCYIEGAFSSVLFGTLQFLENNWEDLVGDIQSGRLKESLNIGDDKRAIINSFLVPDAERAKKLEAEFKKGMDGILQRIFPKMVSIECVSSGFSMDMYRKRCAPFAKGLDLYSTMYVSSEGFIGVNMQPSGEQKPAYVVFPSFVFAEYLPLDENGLANEEAEPLLANQVQIGELYELVITNCCGLYRYRIGDIIKVVGFYKQAPAIDFQYRSGQFLNVHSEKIPEQVFYDALKSTVAQWPGVVLRDFACAESLLDPFRRPGANYYLVFLELETGDVTDEQLNMLDAELCQQAQHYRMFRRNEAIAPPKVMVVKPATFSLYKDAMIGRNSVHSGQFKQPRVLRHQSQVDVFLKNLA